MAEFNIWLLLSPFIIMSFLFGVGIILIRKKFRLWFSRKKFKEKAIDILIISKNKSIFHGVAGINQDKFNYNDEDYLIDEEAIYTEKFLFAQRPYSIYLEGNPKPIQFDFETNKPELSSVDLKSFAQSKLIQQLLNTTEEKMIMFLMILVIVSLIAIGVLGYMFVTKSNIMIEQLADILKVIK